MIALSASPTGIRRQLMLRAPCGMCTPYALCILGHLHILRNALKEAVSGLPMYTAHIDHLRALGNFLPSKILRQKFQACCLGG